MSKESARALNENSVPTVGPNTERKDTKIFRLGEGLIFYFDGIFEYTLPDSMDINTYLHTCPDKEEGEVMYAQPPPPYQDCIGMAPMEPGCDDAIARAEAMKDMLFRMASKDKNDARRRDIANKAAAMLSGQAGHIGSE